MHREIEAQQMQFNRLIRERENSCHVKLERLDLLSPGMALLYVSILLLRVDLVILQKQVSLETPVT